MPAQPQDHKSSAFTYTFESGDTVTLPPFESVMTFGRARRLRALPPDEQVFAVMEEICDEEQLGVLDKMMPAETEAFFTAWQGESGATLGE